MSAALPSDDLPAIDEEAARERELSETLLRAQADLGEAFVLVDGRRVVFANAEAVRISGRAAAELTTVPGVDVLVPEDQRDTVAGALRALAEGRAVAELQTAILRPDGSRVEIEVAAQPVPGDPRRRVVAIARDVTERVHAAAERERLLQAERRTRQELEVAHRRASFLADAGVLLERSLDVEECMVGIADLVLAERVADVVAVDVLEPGGTLRRVAAGARGRDAGDAMREAGAARRIPVDAEHPAAQAVREGRRVVVERMRRLPAVTGLVQPLVAGGRTRGALSLGWYPGDEPALAGPESRLILELAGRMAMAIDSAQLYEERAHVARSLQDSLLPPVLAEVPGLAVAARYLPGSATLDVGGDFYDLFAAGPGTWNVLVGDVCGKGAEAAAMTAMTRYTLRALAERHPGPAELLADLNGALLRDGDQLRFVTAVLGRLQRRGSGFRLEAVCAGHPPPLVARAGGGTESIRCPGPLLGVRADASYAAKTVDLGPGDVVVLHTDGLSDVRREAPLTPADLLAVMARHRAGGPDAVAGALVEHARAVQGPDPPDDLALLAFSPLAGG